MSDFPLIEVGAVTVSTTEHGGHPPEYYAERIVARLIAIGDDAPEPIRAQAYAFRSQMQQIILEGIKRAIESDRVYSRKD